MAFAPTITQAALRAARRRGIDRKIRPLAASRHVGLGEEAGCPRAVGPCGSVIRYSTVVLRNAARSARRTGFFGAGVLGEPL